MGFIVEDGGDFEKCPSGMHLARCYRIVDLGTQKKTFQGTTTFKPLLKIFWEIHGTDDNGQPILMKDGRPFSADQDYTRSWSEKSNLRIMLQSWRGKPFSAEESRRLELETVLGKWCMLNIIHNESKKNGRIYANVNSVSPVPSLIIKNGFPNPFNKTEIFDLKNPNMEVFEGFYDFLKQTIMASPEWQKLDNKPPVKDDFSSPTPMADDDEDTIPF